MNLRPYQSDCCREIWNAWFPEGDADGVTRVLAVLPTGAGKTIIASIVARRCVDEGLRVLFLAHREELLLQTIDKFRRAAGIEAHLEKAEHRAHDDAEVVVGSVQTFSARGERWDSDHFDVIIVDEAHHVLADSYRYVLDLFPDAKVLGITATPDRGDKKNLGAYFETIAFEIGLFDLVNTGFLAPITVQSIPLSIDLNGVKSSQGDFDAGDLGAVLDPYLDQIAAAIRQHAHCDGLPRRTLVFLPLIATSLKFVESCKSAGLVAAHVDGLSPDRREILDRFGRGEFDVLSNAMLLTEGFDDPGIECVCVLRPTRSRALYSQMVGRGTRLAPGKRDLLLLDFLWNHTRHQLCRPAHLIASSELEAETITRLTEEDTEAKAGAGMDQLPLDLQGLATAATAQREEALRKKLAEQSKKKATVLTAEEFAMQHNSLAAAEYQETMPWESAPVTEKQAKALKRAKIDLATVRGKGHASQLIGLYFKDKDWSRPSPAQTSLMTRMQWKSADGLRGASEATVQEARQFFADLNAGKKRTSEPMLI